MDKTKCELRLILEDSLQSHQRMLDESLPVLEAIAVELSTALRQGKKLLLCGNGGSAADAQHVAGELVGRFLKESEPWPALALTTDTSILTAIGNDWSYDEVFSRQVRAFARPGDIVVGISTSGNSTNIIRALEQARECNTRTIGFTGAAGGQIPAVCDLCYMAPAQTTPRIQELHLLAWHAICEVVEDTLLDDAGRA